MNYIITHSNNDCYIALCYPALFYKRRGYKYASNSDDEWTISKLNSYIQSYNRKIWLEIRDCLDDISEDLSEKQLKTKYFADKKEVYKKAVGITSENMNHQVFDSLASRSYETSYLLSKINQKLVGFHSEIQTMMRILNNRLTYSEHYHSRKLNCFIEGVRSSDPKLADRLDEIKRRQMIKAISAHRDAVEKLNENPMYHELVMQLEDYNNIFYPDDDKEADRDTICNE